jgi:metallo-beta-lactamase family protein
MNGKEMLIMAAKEWPYVDIMSASPEVTGSLNLGISKLPNTETIRFVLDCGFYNEPQYARLNYELPFNPEHIEFAVVTHNHIDHTGRLPFMVKKGFNSKIYATASTCKLMPSALRSNSTKLRKIARRQNKSVLYSDADVDRTLELLEPCPFYEKICVHENVNLWFFPNGHLMGAAMVLVQIHYPGYQDVNILFTGDYNNKNMFFDVPRLPQWVLNLPLTVVQESTYGDLDSQEPIFHSYSDNICKCLSNNGTIISLGYSLGRVQELLYTLKTMQQSGKLDEEVPIYLDGTSAIEYTLMYRDDGLDINDEMRDFLPTNLHFVNDSIRQDILSDKGKKIIVTPSGSGAYGPAQIYISEYIRRPNALIQFSGHLIKGSFAYNLFKAKKDKTVYIGGLMAKKRATVKYTSEFSAHARANEMIAFLKEFTNLRLVLVNHGSIESKDIFSDRILEEVSIKNVGILGNGYFFRITNHGLIKTMSTKFY